jgi:transposase
MPKRNTQAEPTLTWKQLDLRFAWEDQRHYEIIRPVVLFGQSAEERACETDMPVRTLYQQLQRFQSQGIAGLVTHASPPPRHTLPADVRHYILTAKAEHPPLCTNEIATMCYAQFGRRPDRKTINRILAEHPLPPVQTRRFPRFHDVPDPAKRRASIIRLHVEGWSKKAIAAYLGTSRQTVHETLQRWIRDGVASLYPRSRAPKRRVRKVTLAIMLKVRRLQRNPLLGAFRIHAALKQEGISISPRTCSRILAINRKLYDDVLPKPTLREKKPMPFAAHYPHEIWTIDIRYLDMVPLGPMPYCITILDNYSRAVVASAISRRKNLASVLIVLFAALRNHGAPKEIVSDGEHIFKAKQLLNIYHDLGIMRAQIDKRQSWQSYLETNFNVQRRMADDAFSNVTNWADLLAEHERWIGSFNYQSHWAHKDRDDGKRSPFEVLDGALGVVYSEQDLHRVFYTTRFTRRLDKIGYVRFRNWRLYGEAGLAHEAATLWLYNEELTVVFGEQPLAYYTVEYQPDHKHFRSVTDPQVIETPYRSPQLALWELGEGEWLKILRLPPPAPRTKRLEAAAGVQESLPLELNC